MCNNHCEVISPAVSIFFKSKKKPTTMGRLLFPQNGE